jgi:hypothetical protein
MNSDNLKTAWQAAGPANTSETALRSMMRESRHPALKKIRTQLLIESILFTFLLAVYRDIFDGDRRPAYANWIFTAAVCLVILLGIIGYVLARRQAVGADLVSSLNERLSNLKIYTVVFLAARVFWAVALLIFLTSIVTFDTTKYWIAGAIIAVFLVQMLFLARMWVRRINALSESIRQLTS